jgi:hypothetical protein
MNHPKSRGERRRVNKKKYIVQEERDEAVARRLAQEALEAREALDELRGIDHKQIASD